ncbi:MAG: exodeoxyribonuclease V subunit gamma, partial [Victivallales bacterium]|nr:exodeoxyribonuclease V subunit gamma [Victivallales bacterium]
KLCQVTPVHFFCRNPCDGLWKDNLREDWSTGQTIQEPPELDELFDGSPLRQWAGHEREFFKYAVDISRLPACATVAETKARDWRKKSPAPPLKEHLTKGVDASTTRPDGILQRLQAQLRGKALNPPQADLSKDDTLTIHCCHNALREVEILHDHLLHLIETRHYTNSDIIVAAPDISEFLPFIEAVFQQPVKVVEGKELRLATSVCGRSLGQSNPLGNALVALLDIGRNRYELPYVEKLLNYTEIRSRFGIEEEDIRVLVQWCRDAGIRWGKDGDHKKYGFPDFENFSWRHGLDRMLLGLAVTDDDSVNGVWEKAAPYSVCDYPEGHAKLQRLLALLQALQEAEERLAAPCALEEWRARLEWLMDTFFKRDLERKAYYRGLWNAINHLLKGLGQSGHTEIPLPLEVVREAIVSKIDVADEDSAFLGGAITFCNLRDARGIPCKVLCLLGMDNGKYPRRNPAESLNLIAGQLENENRTVSQQDRYFFLESLLAARDYLLIYYRGLDDTSEQRYYPSTLVSELKSHVKKLVGQEDFSLEIRQSLLPYSHRYFRQNENGSFTLRNLWSYKKEFRAIDAMYVEDGEAVLDIFDFGNDQQAVPAAGIDAEPQAVELPEMLIRQRESFRNTALQDAAALEEGRHKPIVFQERELEYFLENGGFTLLKKGLTMPRQKKMETLLENSEPLKLDTLAEWQVRVKLNRWLNELLPQGETVPGDDILTQCFERLKAENMIPITANDAEMMQDYLKESWIQDSALCLEWREQMNRENKRLVTVSFDNEVPQVPDCPFADLPERFADLDNIPGNPYAHVEVQYETMKESGERHIYCALASDAAKHRLRGWVRHLVHNAGGDSVPTVIVWKDGKTTDYSPMKQETARKYLKALIALYLYGQRNAVPLLCNCSVAAAKEIPDPDKPRKWPNKYVGDFGADIDLDYAMMLWARNKAEFTSQEELLTCIEALARNVIRIEEA